ncbi:molybdenum-dependent transcriptional regulator [Erwinia sorbitola]|uniref:Molybdenum-dependent transcriptional regulator n=1 Tax=Erwinia sorbitola TaxID=2681984 RepID=A0A6I6ETE7_9GAMM|nr:molybdenum-dependent transcriptional regulator [Erwinia sorbitola]QGU88349.1 molybdenum-dependent transcriptional regulator [Erwinia sorbitola]
MQADISLILKLQQRLFADPRRIELLRQVKESGSISQGAKLAGISYKSAWDAINEMNQLADRTLVERATGGKGGGGALVTSYGERLIQLYELLEQIQQKAFDVLQDDAPLGSLLGAIARFSLQTSARNQLYGTIVTRDDRPVQQHVMVQLADGQTQIKVALTEVSANRLQLTSGKEVLVLIKAPWIDITSGSAYSDNQLPGTISQIEQGDSHSEVLISVGGGETLCATVDNQHIVQQKLQPGTAVTACFNADRVIIATLL